MPDFRDLFTKASGLMQDGQHMEAILILDRVLLDRPDFTPAWIARGAAVAKMGDPFDAILCYDRAVALAPNAPEAYNNRGVAYMELEKFDKAIQNYNKATSLNPSIAECYNNCGNVFMHERKPAEALEQYRKAWGARPDYADPHVGEAMALLMLGRYEEGWKEFEWRWKSGPMKSRGLTYPTWEGERANSPDDILLFYGEQGMGDVLQFCRYVKPIKERWGGKVFIECVHPLVRLLQSVEGVDHVYSLGDNLPSSIKYCLAMMSAPRVLKTTVETIPNEVPYLKADSFRANIWDQRLKLAATSMRIDAALRIGLCWAGMNRERDRTAASIDARRSMDLSLFKPLGGINGILWASLQLGPPKDQLKNNPAGMALYDGTPDLYDFYDTAALISCLDLVITVDTSVAHVAGALGKPTWLLSRHDACWRWLMDRDDSPWYPTMKLYTQRTRHDWVEVIERVHIDLLKLANEHRLRNVA